MTTLVETVLRFRCFGSDCAVAVAGDGAEHAAAEAQDALLSWHRRFSRFEPDSELSRLNADPRGTVPVTPMMARFVQAAIDAARSTSGLVDATLLGALEDAGYRRDLRGSLPEAIALGRRRRRRCAPAGARSTSTRWPAPSAARRACDSTAAASRRACSPTRWPSASPASTRSRSTAAVTCASAGT
jgi:ApbE family